MFERGGGGAVGRTRSSTARHASERRQSSGAAGSPRSPPSRGLEGLPPPRPPRISARGVGAVVVVAVVSVGRAHYFGCAPGASRPVLGLDRRTAWHRRDGFLRPDHPTRPSLELEGRATRSSRASGGRRARRTSHLERGGVGPNFIISSKDREKPWCSRAVIRLTGGGELIHVRGLVIQSRADLRDLCRPSGHHRIAQPRRSPCACAVSWRPWSECGERPKQAAASPAMRFFATSSALRGSSEHRDTSSPTSFSPPRDRLIAQTHSVASSAASRCCGRHASSASIFSCSRTYRRRLAMSWVGMSLKS